MATILNQGLYRTLGIDKLSGYVDGTVARVVDLDLRRTAGIGGNQRKDKTGCGCVNHWRAVQLKNQSRRRVSLGEKAADVRCVQLCFYPSVFDVHRSRTVEDLVVKFGVLV